MDKLWKSSAVVTSAAVVSAVVAVLIAARRQLRSTPPKRIPRRAWKEDEDGHRQARAEPFVLTAMPLGSCSTCWTGTYIAEAVGDLKVSAHVSTKSNLNFAVKNFSYEVMPMQEFLERARRSGPDKRYYYYRSQHASMNKPSNLEILGTLAKDFTLPPELLQGFPVHSTVLRIASPGLKMWLHYDVCDNFLCCVRGRKRVVVLSPREVGQLYIKGSSSTMGSAPLDRDLRGAWAEFPLAEAAWARRWETELDEGDVLFIPALWPHCTEALPENGQPRSDRDGLCISVNAFFLRPELESLHDSKDVWANAELLPAQEALQSMTKKMLPALERLPAVHRSFYCRKIAATLLAAAEAAEQSEGP